MTEVQAEKKPSKKLLVYLYGSILLFKSWLLYIAS